MTDPHFFGYGSLVNRRTHSYPHARPAQLKGWRREWVRTASRDVVFLSVRPDADTSISGLVAAVPDADWKALDAREFGYDRHAVTETVDHKPKAREVSVYSVPRERHLPGGDHVILMSYLDTVVQGFLQEFGQQGVADFFATTDGWETPIVDDRAAPRYSRHNALSTSERALVDTFIKKSGARTLA